ncbi:MAG: acetate/propionate family kinase [Nitrospira sp.]|nr:acetate/propionate family kinase [Nitrospira sp.]MDH4249917.1 acetate/propionate family kinase [Nitrospira sp.]MDH4343422.1 acetate/propionate family kinase [Nitrospira sp.]MDH5336294.1 acetate/propionate family kinase [Nitrospira sp.]
MNQTGPGPFILTVNGGSSSIKFALYTVSSLSMPVVRGMIERIGIPESVMHVTTGADGHSEHWPLKAPDHRTGATRLLAWLEEQVGLREIRAIGHRVVHGGGRYHQPEMVTAELLDELRRISPYVPEHLPAEIGLIEFFRERCPTLQQVACFDTAFHRDMPRVARLLAIPRRYQKLGLQRYGFHGLSCAFLMKELARIGNKGEADGRVVLAHLGNGASLTAVKDGKSVETTMGFTPTSGLPMSRRSGDLDPGLFSYLARTEGMTVDRFHRMVNAESGLLGVSETSSDMRDLLKEEQNDARAAEAVALFCYHAKKAIGSLAAALGGLDTLVFSAGIGEHSPTVRARICEGLEFLGIAIDSARNEAGEAVISSEGSRVTVRVIHTDEESEIARSVVELIGAEL